MNGRNGKRMAAIDVGTNSIRCIVVEAEEGGDFRILDDEKAQVRLGEGLAETGRISAAAWERGREALLRMKKIADGLEVGVLEGVATSAVRRASNGMDFLKAMKSETGIGIRLISGEEEAELALLSARRHFDMGVTRYLLADFGGGSVEIVSVTGSHIEEIFSLELGAVFLTETFLPRDPIPEKDFQKLRRHVRETLRKRLDSADGPVSSLIASGGAATSIGGMAMHLRGESYESVHGYEVFRSELVHLLAMLRRQGLKERRSVPGLNPERADIIVAGVTVADELMRHFGINLLRINERGIREGLIQDLLQKHGLASAQASPDWRSAVEEFARSCRVDLPHSAHVTSLALEIYRALAGPAGLGEREKKLLEGAGLLHDVGYFISYSQHHKHSYHLIRHAEIFGFTPREREIMANVARYHRKALPKKKHESFTRLSPEDQSLVRKLGGILRLADGLDRRRSGAVRSLKCTLRQGEFRVDLEGEGDLSVEIYGGRAKSDLFEEAFNCRLVLQSDSAA